jgi:hypothetical protein
MAKIEKYSFHKSGLCRSAFTSEHGTPDTMADRAMFKWRRLSTPPAGDGRAARVAWLIFPSDYLSKLSDLDGQDVVWVNAAPAGEATHVEISFTHESQEFIRRAFAEHQERSLLAYFTLTGEEALLVNCRNGAWENSDLNMPGEGKVADLVFSPRDPYDTGRPIRIRFGRTPSDGDALVLLEVGGYAMPTPPTLHYSGSDVR